MTLSINEYVVKFFKFGAVGFSGIAVDFAVTYIFKEKINLQKYFANMIGFSTAASYNYLLNRVWTFHSHNNQVINEYLIFMTVSVIGLGMNTLILWYLVSKNHNFYIAKMFAIAVTMSWNFTANMMCTFSS